MRIIGLTGSIASGKSTVSAMLRELGAAVIDADAIVHHLQRPGTPVFESIVREFGPGVVRPDGSLDRQALGRIVFADPGRRRALEAIVHPAVRAEIWRQVEQYRREGRPAVVLDVPLLYESGWDRQVDEVWVVWVDAETQKARLIARSGLSPEEAEARIAAQMSLDEKARRADRIIDNRGSLDRTRAQVEAAWRAACGGEGGEPAAGSSAHHGAGSVDPGAGPCDGPGAAPEAERRGGDR
ncbi:dephospho-CoA kinase [Symbiobacterium thermophilum]|uniref:Dephospho-CoA kinase n=2 Tax=Symbiobacterium thermophilum TaxID=2734 RepID=A0A953LJK7_SYMTR|nr:dephospho-CoA kinase [Symbiobacterium thermophilum]MBY6275977.1 dephospho-CoA kinase [Symbiobacterium thermophilum]